MIDLDTAFRKDVRKRKLKSPTSPDFVPDDWRSAFKELAAPDSDCDLMNAAGWLAYESGLLRTAFDDARLTQLGSRHTTVLAVAVLNWNFHEIARRAGRAVHVQPDTQSIDINHLIQTPIPGGGQVLDADSRLEAVIEATGSWIWDAAERTQKQGGKNRIDLRALTVAALRKYSLQHGLRQLWQQALWEGWRLQSDAKPDRWEPADRQLAKLFDAWMARQSAQFMDVGWRDSGIWTGMSPDRRRAFQLEKTVLRVSRQKGRGLQFEIGRPSTKGKFAPPYVLDRAGLEASYLGQFLDTPLPLVPVCNCRLLLRAWHVLRDLADVFLAGLQRPSFNDLKQIEPWALTFERKQIVDVLERALQLSNADAVIVLDFLTWNPKAYKRLWAAPIVPIPGTSRLCMARTVLSVSEGIRRTEIWLHKGGLDDSLGKLPKGLEKPSKGLSYEQFVRAELSKVMAENGLLTDARCVGHSIKTPKSGQDRSEQIDLVIQLGSTLIVADVKCRLSPADPCERHHYVQNLRGAVEQTTRKAALLDRRRDVVSQLLKISDERAKKLRIIPLVVMNQGFGASLEIDGCRIIDFRFLRIYLGSGEHVADGAIDTVTGHVGFLASVLYSSQEEAEQLLEKFMAEPPVLQRLLNRMQCGACPFKMPSGNELLIEVHRLADMSDQDRARTSHLRSALAKARATAP